MSAGQMPSNSQCVFKYHRNTSLTFLGGKRERFGECGAGGPLCVWWDTGGPGLDLENSKVSQKMSR